MLILDYLPLLEKLFGEVVIPEAVYHELLALKSFGYDTNALAVEWIRVERIVPDSLLNQRLSSLDIGEIEAIALAYHLQADWLLIDEKKGRQSAEALGIRIIGLLGVLVKAKQEGIITRVKPAVDKLTSVAEFRMSQSLIELVLRMVDEA